MRCVLSFYSVHTHRIHDAVLGPQEFVGELILVILEGLVLDVPYFP